MSAFLCNQEHLNALVNYAAAHARMGCHFGLMVAPAVRIVASGGTVRHAPPATDADHTFAMLLQENLRSLGERYDEPKLADWYSGDPADYSFRFELHKVWSPVQIIKACHCYAYQSCEHEGWESSEVKRWIDNLERHAIGHLPGYEKAAWEITA